LGDTPELTRGYRPTGSIVFTLSGPGGFSFTETDTVGGNGTYAAGATLPATGTAAGTYTWTATYGGDPNDNPVTSSPEPVTIAQSTTTIHITPTPPSGPVGTSLSASATVSGDSPTGTVTFQLYPPSDPTCTGTPAFTSTEALSSGSATSGSDTAEIVGIWRWVVTYSGDTNYAGVRSGCQDAQVTITAAGATAPAAAVPGLPNTGAGAPGFGPSGHKPPALALLLLGALGLAGVAVGSITRRRRSRSGAPPADPERA
jgi:hypothetical protein